MIIGEAAGAAGLIESSESYAIWKRNVSHKPVQTPGVLSALSAAAPPDKATNDIMSTRIEDVGILYRIAIRLLYKHLSTLQGLEMGWRWWVLCVRHANAKKPSASE